MNCNYKVKIKDIQNKYQFKIFCKTYDDTEIQGDIETLNSDVEALQEENLYLNSLVEQAFDKKEVEGEELSINDTINAKMEVGLLGNTTQETTTGKNKCTTKANNTVIATLQAGTYTFSLNSQISGGYVLKKDNGEGEIISGTNYISVNNQSTATFTLTEETSIFINGYSSTSGKTFTDGTSEWQLEPGSTASSYEKFTGGLPAPNPDYPQEIHTVTGDNTIEVCNKNLWKFNSSYTPTGYATILNQQPIKLLQGNYILSFSNVVVTSSILFRFYNKDKSRYYDARVTPTAQTPILNAEEDIYYVTLIFNEANSLSDIQLEKGTTATTYEPYQSQSFTLSLGDNELCKIGDYKDYFYKNGDKWYKKEYIGKVVLDGTYQNLSINTTSTDTTRCAFAGILSNPSSQITSMLCNNLQVVQNFSTDVEGIYYNSNNGNLWFRMNKTRIGTTENEINTYLSTHNTIVYYIKETATDIEITDTTLIEQLEELKTAMSYAEQTNISQINDDVPFILKVTALASYNSRIVALENAILNANRSTPVKNTRKSNEVIEEPREEVVDDNKDENIIKEEK